MSRARGVLLLIAIAAVTACQTDTVGPIVEEPPPSAPELLGQFEHVSGGVAQFTFSGVFGLAARYGQLEGLGPQLFEIEITDETEGTSHTFDAISNSEFVARMTNGVDDLLHIDNGLFVIGREESQWFGGGSTGEFQPDFKDGEITHFVVHVDDVVIENVGIGVNHQVTWRLVVMGRRDSRVPVAGPGPVTGPPAP